jgi:hypothetical protein
MIAKPKDTALKFYTKENVKLMKKSQEIVKLRLADLVIVLQLLKLMNLMEKNVSKKLLQLVMTQPKFLLNLWKAVRQSVYKT